MDATIEILSDILEPSLRQDDFTSEKQVILEEIAMYDDQPFWVVYEHAMERFYGTHPLGHRVLGTKQTVGDMTRDQLAEYFSRRYASDNMVFAIAGAFDFDQVVERISNECSEWTPSSPTRERTSRQLVRDDSDITLPDLGQAYLVMLSDAPGVESDDRYAASLLAHTLGGDETSHLYWSLVETGLAEEAQCSYDPRDHAGEFATFAVCGHEALEDVESKIRDEISSISDKLVQDDLDRARARTATAAVISAERPMGRVNRLASGWLRRGTYVPIEEEMSRIDAVTIEDLRACALKYPPNRVSSRARVGELIELRRGEVPLVALVVKDDSITTGTATDRDRAHGRAEQGVGTFRLVVVLTESVITDSSRRRDGQKSVPPSRPIRPVCERRMSDRFHEIDGLLSTCLAMMTTFAPTKR